MLFFVRSDRDSNSGTACDGYTLSRRASSATRASLHRFCEMRCKGNDFYLKGNCVLLVFLFVFDFFSCLWLQLFDFPS